ncbi:MAG: glycosyl transferase family 2 [Cyanobacteria bacterium M5B4]|nr:MAG: glycosyl transferase family 2 [Cyanobacteria bacterium M5B4]
MSPVHERHDALLARVNEEIMLDTFDRSNIEVLQQLVEGLGDSRGLVRLRFAETLGEIGEVATPFLVDALLHHENVVLRRAAAKTLTLIADPEAVPQLFQAFLEDEDTVVRGSAVGALARTGVAAAPGLLEILANPDHPQDIKGHAAWALAFMGAEAADQLFAALNSPHLDVRCAVIGAIAQVAKENLDPSACNVLIQALNDREELIRVEACAALGQLNYPPAFPHLLNCLQDEALEVRKTAITSLGKLGNPEALSALQPFLSDESVTLRTLAKLAIEQINNYEALE